MMIERLVLWFFMVRSTLCFPMFVGTELEQVKVEILPSNAKYLVDNNDDNAEGVACLFIGDESCSILVQQAPISVRLQFDRKTVISSVVGLQFGAVGTGFDVEVGPHRFGDSVDGHDMIRVNVDTSEKLVLIDGTDAQMYWWQHGSRDWYLNILGLPKEQGLLEMKYVSIGFQTFNEKGDEKGSSFSSSSPLVKFLVMGTTSALIGCVFALCIRWIRIKLFASTGKEFEMSRVAHSESEADMRIDDVEEVSHLDPISPSSSPSTSSTPKSPSPVPTLDLLETNARKLFKKNPRVNPTEFEACWKRTDQLKVWGATLKEVPEEAFFRSMFAGGNVHCLASGQVAGVQKFYFFAAHKHSKELQLAMAELSLAIATKRLSCVFKDMSDNEEEVFIQYMKAKLQRNSLDFS